MKTLLQVLSQEEKNRIHESSLKVLANTGVRMDTAKGRRILKKAGTGGAAPSLWTVGLLRSLTGKQENAGPVSSRTGWKQPV